MSKLVKPYEISVWEDVWSNSSNKFQEKRICVIGSDNMESEIKAQSPSLIENVNGTNKFSFKLNKQYIDIITGEKKVNPFCDYLVNERKIKLHYNDKWYDFVVKNIDERSSNYTNTYSCEDAIVQELTKNGFSIILNEQLNNNSGTVGELAEEILKDTDWNVEAEVSVQTIKEPLVYITIPVGQTIRHVIDQSDPTKGVSVDTKVFTYTEPLKVLACYSCCRNKPHFFQFFYKIGGLNFSTDEDKVITTKNCQYFIEFPNEASYTVSDNIYGFILPTGFSITAVSNVISPNYVGARYNFLHESVYEPKLERYVNKYTDEKGEKYRGYATSEYISPELITNIITNTEFKNSSGWTGTNFDSGATQKAAAENVFGRFDGGKFIKAIDELDTNATYTPYMKLSFNSKNNAVINSGPYDNRSSIEFMEEGSEWILKFEFLDTAGNSLEFPSVVEKFNFDLAEYRYDATNGCYKQKKVSTNGVASALITFKQTNKNGAIHFTATKNLYKDKKDFKRNSQVRLKIQPKQDPANGLGEYYIANIVLFRATYNEQGKLIYPEQSAEEFSEENVCVQNRYYYYHEDDLENIKDKNDFQPRFVLDTPDNEKFKPVFSTNAEKIRSVDVKESNYFNNLQTLAEKFEMWVRFIIERSVNGAITKKTVKFQNNVGKINYANIRYGVNLKDIKRTFESKALTTKLIVKDNKNEFATNGFCTIARAASNPTGETCIYDFQYYCKNGLLKEQDVNKYLYGAAGYNKKGYYFQLREINDALDLVTDKATALNTGLLKLKADHEVAFQTIEAANYNLEEAINNIYFLTGIDITQDKVSISAEGFKDRSDVQKQLEAYVVYQQEQIKATNEYSRLDDEIKERETALTSLLEQQTELVNRKEELNKAFFSKYSRFIQEGTWVNEEYNDDEKYYIDATTTLYNSCYPKVTYSINILALSQLPGYENFNFELGDRTFIEDKDFFGSDKKEEIVITEFKHELDSPEKDTIKVQNFKNQFQDLFQKITATTQQAQFKEGAYNSAVAITTGSTEKKTDFLNKALNNAAAMLKAAGQQTVEWGSNGISVIDQNSPCNQIRLIGGAIMISKQDENGQQKWVTAITHEGISASILTAGVINTNEISLMAGDEIAFRWDAVGLTAFNTVIKEETTEYNYNKFVRFDKYGLYGINDSDSKTTDGRFWKPKDEEELDEKASFSLTWNGLKVIGFGKEDQAVEARIGKIYDEKDTLTDFIINVTRTNADKTTKTIFGITNEGYLVIEGSVTSWTGGRIGGWYVDENLIKSDMNNPNAFLSPQGTKFTTISQDELFIIKVGNSFGVTTSGKAYIGDLVVDRAPATKISSDLYKTGSILDLSTHEKATKYQTFFNSLKAYIYKETNNDEKLHFGFMAENIDSALTTSGLAESDLGAYTNEANAEKLKYEEFIVLNTWRIQQLEQRIQQLETQLQGE